MIWLEGSQKVDEFILKEHTKFIGKSHKLVVMWKIMISGNGVQLTVIH